jgi:hypothetical protein
MMSAAQQAGITVGALWWQAAFVDGAHMLGISAFVGAWVVLVYALAQALRKKKAGKVE